MDVTTALTVLNLPSAFNVAQLKAQYKAFALDLHPDKRKYSPEEATQRFSVLTAAYKALLENHMDKQQTHSDLKAGFEQQVASGSVQPVEPLVDPNKKFDTQRFNKVFDKTRQKTVHDSGYAKWMKKEDPDRPSTATTPNKHIQVYHAPAGLSAANKLSFNEIGVEKISDFSGGTQSALNYLDYRLAHSTGKIIPDDEASAGWSRPEYKSVDQLKAAREDPANLRMTSQQHYHQTRLQAKADLREARRVQALRKADADLESRNLLQKRLMFTST